jgi:TonB family protein
MEISFSSEGLPNVRFHVCDRGGGEVGEVRHVRFASFFLIFIAVRVSIGRKDSQLTGGRMKLRLAMFLVFLIFGFAAIGLRGMQNPNLSANDPIILSDTHGYNFEPYMRQLTDRVRTKWYSVMPEAARQGQKGRAVVVFTVLRDGTTQDLRVVAGSGVESLDEAATSSIQSSAPFPMLPGDFSEDRIVVQFAFLYNQR